MFETAVLSYGPPTKRVWATFAGFTGQVALIGCALLAPLLWPQVIPKVAWSIPIVGPPPPPPPKAPPMHASAQQAHVIPVQSNGKQLFQPVSIRTDCRLEVTIRVAAPPSTSMK